MVYRDTVVRFFLEPAGGEIDTRGAGLGHVAYGVVLAAPPPIP